MIEIAFVFANGNCVKLGAYETNGTMGQNEPRCC